MGSIFISMAGSSLSSLKPRKERKPPAKQREIVSSSTVLSVGNVAGNPKDMDQSIEFTGNRL